MKKIFCILILISSVSNLLAITILTQTAQGSRADLAFNGSSWTTYTSMVTAQHTLVSVNNFENLNAQSFDALWVDQELGNTLSANEVTSIQNYVSAGNKAILIGENSSWNDWNNSILSIVGGSATGGCVSEFSTSTSTHPVMDGISGVEFACGSVLSSSTGSPEILVSSNLAGVYQVGAGEVIVILESNFLDNGRVAANTDFANNLLQFLEDPINTVPEPSTFFLSGLTLLFTCYLGKRRRV